MGKIFDFKKRDEAPANPDLADSYERLEKLLTGADVITRGPEYMETFLLCMLIMAVNGIRTLGDDERATFFLHKSLNSIKEEPDFKHSLFEALMHFWITEKS